MSGESRSNNPGGFLPADKVRELQRRLWKAAKQQPGRRSHALYDRIYRRDRVVQMAATLVLEPIFEADFKDVSYGFRPGCSATDALEALRKLGARGGIHVLDADIEDYFGSIDHELLMKRVERRVSDRRVLKLLRQWLKAGVMEEGRLSAWPRKD